MPFIGLYAYVLVSTKERLLEVFRRATSDNDAWSRSKARTHGTVHLESTDCALRVDEAYDGIELNRPRRG